MSLFYFAEKLGNAYVVGCGSNEVAKFWFDTEDEAHSPLTKECAKQQADALVEHLNNTVPIESLSTEVFGDDSEENVKKIRMLDKIADGVDGSDASDMMAKMMLMSLMSD